MTKPRVSGKSVLLPHITRREKAYAPVLHWHRFRPSTIPNEWKRTRKMDNATPYTTQSRESHLKLTRVIAVSPSSSTLPTPSHKPICPCAALYPSANLHDCPAKVAR